MAYAVTRDYINRTLRLLGSNGLSGMTFAAEKTTEAFSELASQVSGSDGMSPQRLLAELRRQELITITKQPGTIKVQLSIKGVHRLQLAEIRSVTVPTQQPWDHLWRMVIFDIPARHAESRYLLTSELKRHGFVMLQNSMWLHPYPCFEQVSTAVQYANLQPFVTYAEISNIDMRSQQRLLSQYPELSLDKRA